MSIAPSSGGAAACPQSPPTATSRRARTPRRGLSSMAGALAVAVFALSACGSQSEHGGTTGDHGSTSATSAVAAGSAGVTSATAIAAPDTAHNAADVAFAQGMIVHHRGALAMSALAADRAGSDAVQQLAARIETAQTPEIELMTGWLQLWSAPVPSDAPSGASEGGTDMSGHDMGGHDMSGDPTTDQAMGMMSDQDMASLTSARGSDFDRLFLEQMIVHHEGAVTMSEAELDDGQSVDALALARTIIDSQTAEIAEMRGLLAAA